MSPIDGAALVFLALVLVWGAFHGALRQALGLLVLVVAFPVASSVSDRLEPAVTRIATLSPEGVACAAWVAAWSVVVVCGGVVLRLAHGPLERARLGGRADAVVGGAIGLAKGVVLLALAVHLVLGWHSERTVPSAVARLRASRTADGAARVERSVEPALRLPVPVAARVGRIHRALAETPPP